MEKVNPARSDGGAIFMKSKTIRSIFWKYDSIRAKTDKKTYKAFVVLITSKCGGQTLVVGLTFDEAREFANAILEMTDATENCK